MKINLRKANIKDLKNIFEIRGEKLPKLQEERFSKQKKKESLYLISFIGGKPAGYVYIEFKGSEKHHTCPNLQDLYVKKALRGKEIAKQILQKTESFLKKLGYLKIGLDVETEEKWIKNFYEKQGFKIKGKPKKISWFEKDLGKEINLDVFYLEKEIKK